MPLIKYKMSKFGFDVLKTLDGKPLTVLADEMGKSPGWVSRALREPPAMEDRRKAIAEHLGIKYKS